MLIYIITFVIFCSCVQSQDFSYDHQEEWPGQCTKGKNQSPINFKRREEIGKNYEPLILINYDKFINANIVNNGHSVRVIMDDRIPIFMTAGSLNETYRLESFHFHWGSEHTVNEKRFDLEIHFVHYATKYQNLTEALKYPNGVTVLTGLYKVSFGNYGSKSFRTLVRAIPLIANTTNVVVPLGLPINPRSFLPKSISEFYRYEGSLTTPDCNEGVLWTVLVHPRPIPLRQLLRLTNIADNEGKKLGRNYRKLQDLNERKIVLYIPQHTPHF